ncbi:MAG: 1-acyl-sn-glycerol-3-phosphate acyltransferase [Lachnospiraceae bacterium]|nr:1-acyl-sn-glycerol-3-phosphate acyltransferase [Lachnospiraceae bacterium]
MTKEDRAEKIYKQLKYKRKKYIENHTRVRGYSGSYIWHRILLPLLKILRISEKQHITVVGDAQVETTKPVIYACTHIGFFDIMILFEAIKKPCWLFWGNPNEDLTTLYGWMARRNGAILIDTYDKEDRKLAKMEAEMLLNQGGSLMIFPEGAWNITDNEPVMKLFKGTVSMALNTNAEIVPIAIEQYGKEFFVNIGRNIQYTNEKESIEQLNCELRDNLATLKWQIWEKQTICVRSEIPADYRDTYIKTILDDADGKYTEKMINDEKYHDKYA